MAQGNDVLFFDIGDCIDRFEPWTEVEQGQNIVELLNNLPTDAVTIGNNEGVGLSHEVLTHLYDHANFPVVISNLFDKETGERPEFAEPYHMLNLPFGVTVAIFGLTAIYPVSYDVVGWDQTAIDDTIQCTLDEIMSHHPDIILFLSHLGADEDERIAKKFPDIHVIFGAHTHHVFEHGEWVDQTLLTGGGKFGTYLGHLTIDYELFEKGMRKKAINEELIATKDLPPVPNEQQRVSDWHQRGREQLTNETVGELPQDLPNDESHINPLQSYTLKAIKAETHADIVLLHSGLFLTPLQKGEVNRQLLHDCLPHPMRLIQLEVSGEQLLEHLVPEIAAMHDKLQYQPIKGLGFRGHIFGELAFSDVVTEKSIDRQRRYRLITVDHLTFLPFFPLLHDSVGKLWGEPFLREVLGNYIAKQTRGGVQ